MIQALIAHMIQPNVAVGQAPIYDFNRKCKNYHCNNDPEISGVVFMFGTAAQ